MWKFTLLLLYLSVYCYAGPLGLKRNMPIMQHEEDEPIVKESSAAMPTEVDDATKPEAAPANMLMISKLTLPSNATSIRADITDEFSCANRSYGYYADVDNDCQIFHVCLPVTYADGKENIFRWSFICPEETIFSQDSFTCMRREDMTIDCGDSFKYYELNRNFGTIEEEHVKHTQNSEHTEPALTALSQEDQESAMTSEVGQEEQTELQVQQQQSQSPLNEPKQPASPFSHTIQPTKEKPTKVQKPYRRKPATAASVSAPKKKPTTPVRRVPQPTTTVQPLAATTIEIIQTQEESKPAAPIRYTKRPATLVTNLKEKPQPIRHQPETTPIRVELYNQKRKRPVFSNRKDVTTLKPIEENVPTTATNIMNPAPTLVKDTKLDTATHSAPTQLVANATKIEQSAAEDILTSQPSETNIIFIKPKPIVPVSEVVHKKVSKPQPTEPVVPSILETTNKIVETPAASEPLEAIEEIPAVIVEVEESKTTAHDAEAQPESIDSSPSAEDSAPAIFEQNSEENVAVASSPSLEELEAQKPATAPESMPASSEMEHPDPMIEQMLSDTNLNANKHTMGGFKPVDPVMAAEAEALIADFLHTLIRSDQTNAKPLGVETSPMSTKEAEPVDKQNNQEVKQQSTTVENAQMIETSSTTVPKVATHPLTTGHNAQNTPNMMFSTNQANGEIFQIPVAVIQAPLEDLMKTEPSTVAKTESEQSKPFASKPISVDDIVELVKERLDQVPATEVIVKETEASSQMESTSQASIPKRGDEIILPIYHRISGEANENMIKAQAEKVSTAEADVSATKSETEPKKDNDNQLSTPAIAVPIKPKVERAQQARSIKTASKMDPRKRRFLFKSDAS